MPGLDWAGPQGTGQMRGRGFFCWRGRGRGWRSMYYATGLTGWQRAACYHPIAPTREQELEALKRQSEFFERSLGEIRKRIEELESKPQEE